MKSKNSRRSAASRLRRNRKKRERRRQIKNSSIEFMDKMIKHETVSDGEFDCPNCGSSEQPLFGPVRELTNPDHRSGMWVHCCPDCKFVYSATF